MSTLEPNFNHRFIPSATQSTQGDAATLLLLHGTGGNESSLLPIGQTLAPDSAILSPRGQILENGMPRFFRRLKEGVFDLEDLKYRTHELANFVGAAAQAYGFDTTRVIAVGYSNGANIAASTLLLRPGVLAGAVLLRAMVPLEPENLPDLSGVPIFLAGGRFDPIIPPDNTERLATVLREAKADVTLRWDEGDHSLSRDEINAARDWLAPILDENA